jgi:predicted aspartyl protease
MDHTVALAELLSRHDFHRHAVLRNQVGHLQLIGQLQGRPIDILVDTGAASTVVDVA